MYRSRLCNAYIKGLDAFIDFAKKVITTENKDSFIGANINVGTQTDEYMGSLMNIRAVRFDFDLPHKFISVTTSPMNIRALYSSMTWHHR
jgi:hypothetical protein